MKIYNSKIIYQILLTIDTDSYLHRIFIIKLQIENMIFVYY